MTYQVGSLVKTRGREWVVQPGTDADWLIVRPLGGTAAETTGIYLPLEGDDVQPAVFALPDPGQPGDFVAGRLLRDAVRLGLRSGAGPFRSAARISVEPRPYQLVPLLMALKLDPVRLLIADDVGIGKTIEASLIARELLDRGEIRQLAVLCPPYLAEQWQTELADKFHIDAELVLPSTVTRLERHTAVGQSLFDLYPFVVVSTDYIKQSRRRDEFVRSCPEFVIIDEAHTVAFNQDKRSGRHLRHRLAEELAADPRRHLVLTTATPHSGDEGAFRSLLALLRRDFAELPENLSGREHERHRRAVAQHMIQRRRADIRRYMGADTAFPERVESELHYTLAPEYKKLFTTLLDYARERVADRSGTAQQQRVRWWSALALLRSLSSSPAAAAATLRTRSGTAETDNLEEADEVGERLVLDLIDTEAAELVDVTPGSQADEEDAQRDRLLAYARRADALRGPQHDHKLAKAIELVKQQAADGYNPILFCRFIATAEYLAEHLRSALPTRIAVEAVTGLLPPAERESRVHALAQHPRRVLVATDCLSEGINLQQQFDAVIHYDLSWNPTRHEQREGRVDRYGQQKPTVRAVTYYGIDNQIDGIVLEVLLRKHKSIRSSLGISVPVPAGSNELVQALMEGVLLRGGQRVDARQLALQFADDSAKHLNLAWENVSAREKQSRTLFAQHRLDEAAVAAEWNAMRSAIGDHVDVARFMQEAIRAEGGSVEPLPGGAYRFHLPNTAALKEAIGGVGNPLTTFDARFELPAADGQHYLSRTHPFVEGLANHIAESALDPLRAGRAARCGAMQTRAVAKPTTLLLLRLRYHIEQGSAGQAAAVPLPAEEVHTVAFAGFPRAPDWLAAADAERLLLLEPDANVSRPQATSFLTRILADLPLLQPALEQIAAERAERLLATHRRVRAAARLADLRHTVRPQLPVDILGLYLLLPA